MERLGTETTIRRALNDDNVTVVYQPMIDLTSGRVVGAEALVRIEDPDNGLLVPSAHGDRRCKYVDYDRLARLYEACGPNSVLAVFQHAARHKWPDHLVGLGQKVKEGAGLRYLFCIAPDGAVAYFIAAKTDIQARRLGVTRSTVVRLIRSAQQKLGASSRASAAAIAARR